MIYSDIVNEGKILPKKDFYTVRDVNRLIVESLFNSNLGKGKTLSIVEATFIVICSATYHRTDYSKGVKRVRKRAFKQMERII